MTPEQRADLVDALSYMASAASLLQAAAMFPPIRGYCLSGYMTDVYLARVNLNYARGSVPLV